MLWTGDLAIYFHTGLAPCVSKYRLEFSKLRGVHYSVSNTHNKGCCGPEIFLAIYFYTGLAPCGSKHK